MQWKERGKGVLKVLEEEGGQRARLVFRRDQVLKIAANHFLSGVSDLKPMGTTPNAVSWTAQDVSDADDQGVFNYAVKFKSAERMAAFQVAFDQGRKLSGAANATTKTIAATSSRVAVISICSI